MSVDDPGAGPEGFGQASAVVGGQVHSQLVEALVLLLIEKGVLTKDDALSIVQTVAEVQRGMAVEQDGSDAEPEAALAMLRRLYNSFDALDGRPAAVLADAANVHQLRPPIYSGRPEFPRDD